jgi:hypothetical protein
VWKLREPHIIRRAFGHPNSSNQAFYYNLLLQHIPFRDEHALLPADGNYFVECVRRDLFTTTAELDIHLQRYAKYHLWTSAILDKMRADIADTTAAAAAAALGSPNEAHQADPDSADVLLAGATAYEAMQHLDGEKDPTLPWPATRRQPPS